MKKVWSKYNPLRSRSISKWAVRKSIRHIWSIPRNSNRVGNSWLINFSPIYDSSICLPYVFLYENPYDIFAPYPEIQIEFELWEWCFKFWERFSIPRSRIWKSTRRIEALEWEIVQEFQFNIFFSLFLVLYALFIAFNSYFLLLNMHG
jgi:hypothetical protein